MDKKTKWQYRNIPVKPEVYEELEGIKNEVQKEIGVKVDWNSFIWGILVGEGTTAVDVAITKAVGNYRKEKGRRNYKNG